MPAARACVPVSVRGLNTHGGLRILLAAFIAFTPLSECWAVGPEATGRWSRARDLGNQAIHLALLRPPAGGPHSYIMFWEILNVAAHPDTLRGGLLAWNEPAGSPCDPSIDTHNITFESFASQPPMDPFCAGHSALADGRLLVTGGHLTDPVGPKKTSIFDAATRLWSAAINMAGGRWYGSNVALSDTRTAVFGGSSHLSFVSYGGRHDGTLNRDPRLQRLYVDDQQAWQPLLKIGPDPFAVPGQPVQPTTRTGHTLIANEPNPPILFGGRDSTGAPYREMWFLLSEYNDYGESFKWNLRAPVDRHLVPKLSGHSAIMDTSGKMWVFGGLDSVPAATNKLSRWEPTTVPPNQNGRWFPLQLSGPPSARQHHTAIYDNASSRNRMLVFGGLDADSNAISDNSIWALNLSTLTWSQPTVTVIGGGSPPSARGGHTMLTYEFALNGKHRTVLFGGKGASSYLNDIWERWIDDATGALSWQQVTLTGGPSGRAFHTAVHDVGWQRIIISGGETAPYTASDQTWGLAGFNQTTLGPWSALASNTGNGRIGQQTLTGPKIYTLVPETFTPSGGTGSWTTLDSAYKDIRWYPFTFPLPSGNVFYAGPAGGVTTFVLDLGVTPPRWKSQTYPSLHAGGSAVMYEPGSVLKAGSPLNVAPSNQSERIRLQANDEPLDDPPWKLHGPLESVRVNHNLTVLPNGKVLASGGTTDKNETVYLRQPELWDPATGNWTGGAGDDSLAISYIGRGYHSSAILLPDGRVMTAGSNGTPGADSSLIYCPPYLFTTGGAAATRPTIDSAVVQVNYSQDLVIKTSASQDIAQVVLMRPGAATHGFDQGQLRVPLTFTKLTGAPRLVVKGPANACIAPPGNYLLFIVKSNPDTPSIAQWVTVGSTTADATKPRTMDNMYVDIVGSSEVWLAWTAPGDDVNAGTSCSYDLRQQLTPISSDAAFAGAERPVPQPITQLGGTLQSYAVTGLAPCTQYYFSAKARDDWANWSLLGNSAEGTTSCGGGGGFARAPAGAPIASLRTTATSDAEPAGHDPGGGALAAEMRRTGGAPEWTVYPLGALEAAALAAEDPAAGIVMQSRDAGGAWVTTGRRYPSTGGQMFGLRGFRDPGRAVFLGDYTLRQAYGTVGAGAAAGQAFDVVTARHSRLGDLTAAMDLSGVYDSSLEAGDTLRLTYGATDQPARATEDWFMLVAPVGSSAASGRRRGPAEGVALPTAFALYGNQPNPFRGTTVIPFDLPVAVSVRIEVYDVLGRKVATLADALFPAGFHSVEWDLRERSGIRARPGIYLYQMTAGAFRAKGKMSVIE